MYELSSSSTQAWLLGKLNMGWRMVAGGEEDEWVALQALFRSNKVNGHSLKWSFSLKNVDGHKHEVAHHHRRR